ncbi:MAG: 50S ribosomal protein L18 [Cytophagales bacterium]|nr:50S ribosomal protein L18 [Cytophagales bacterium]
MSTVKESRRFRIHKRIRKSVVGTAERPRLSVFRSNTDIYAQLIDDQSGKTVVSYSSLKLKSEKLVKIEASKRVGLEIAKLALDKGLTSIVFDRGGYLYHGRVKALAEGAREAGLKF